MATFRPITDGAGKEIIAHLDNLLKQIKGTTTGTVDPKTYTGKELLLEETGRSIGSKLAEIMTAFGTYIAPSAKKLNHTLTIGTVKFDGTADKTIAEATASAAGLLSATDKAKLDKIEAGAQKNTVTGVKGGAESDYRTGDINLTPQHIGAEPAFSKNTAFNKNFGTTSGTVCQGDDSRLSDARTPKSHTHAKSEVGLGNVDNVRQYSSSNPPPYPVTSVNGKTGAVDLREKTVTINGSKITMADFVANCKKGSYNVIGTEATIENFISGKTVTVRLIGTNHDVDALIGSTIKTTWECVTTLCKSSLGLPFDYYDNQSSGTTYPSNMHGYRTAADLQTTLNAIFGMLEPELQRGIVLASKPCYVKRRYRTTSGDQGAIENVACHLFLLSATEIGAGTNTWFETEGKPYAYYADLNSVDSVETREKLDMNGSSDWYWLRTAYKSSPSNWMYVSEGGNVYGNYTSSSGGASPAFCI